MRNKNQSQQTEKESMTKAMRKGREMGESQKERGGENGGETELSSLQVVRVGSAGGFSFNGFLIPKKRHTHTHRCLHSTSSSNKLLAGAQWALGVFRIVEQALEGLLSLTDTDFVQTLRAAVLYGPPDQRLRPNIHTHTQILHVLDCFYAQYCHKKTKDK